MFPKWKTYFFKSLLKISTMTQTIRIFEAARKYTLPKNCQLIIFLTYVMNEDVYKYLFLSNQKFEKFTN